MEVCFAFKSHWQATQNSTHLYLGGFQNGDTSLYPGNNIVSRSIALGEPVVYVSANYRLSGTPVSLFILLYHHAYILSSRSARLVSIQRGTAILPLTTSDFPFRTFRFAMGARSHCIFWRWCSQSHDVRTSSSSLTKLTFFRPDISDGAKVQVHSQLVHIW